MFASFKILVTNDSIFVATFRFFAMEISNGSIFCVCLLPTYSLLGTTRPRITYHWCADLPRRFVQKEALFPIGIVLSDLSDANVLLLFTNREGMKSGKKHDCSTTNNQMKRWTIEYTVRLIGIFDLMATAVVTTMVDFDSKGNLWKSVDTRGNYAKIMKICRCRGRTNLLLFHAE